MTDNFSRWLRSSPCAAEEPAAGLRQVIPLSPIVDPEIPMEVVESVAACEPRVCDVTAIDVDAGAGLTEKPYGMKARRTASFRINDDVTFEAGRPARKYNSLPRPKPSRRAAEASNGASFSAPAGGLVSRDTSHVKDDASHSQNLLLPLIALASVSTVTPSDELVSDEPVKVMQVRSASPVTSSQRARTHLSVSSLLQSQCARKSQQQEVTSDATRQPRHIVVRSKSVSHRPRKVGYLRCESEVTTEVLRCDAHSLTSSAPAVLDRSVRKQVLEMDAFGSDEDGSSERSVSVRPRRATTQ